MVMTHGGLISSLFPWFVDIATKKYRWKIVLAFMEIVMDKCGNRDEKLWKIWSYILVNGSFQRPYEIDLAICKWIRMDIESWPWEHQILVLLFFFNWALDYLFPQSQTYSWHRGSEACYTPCKKETQLEVDIVE